DNNMTFESNGRTTIINYITKYFNYGCDKFEAADSLEYELIPEWLSYIYPESGKPWFLRVLMKQFHDLMRNIVLVQVCQ
ncbi:MAG: hypothetical protein KAH48_08160, partial [Chlorobi bacterium]|nr:hypothetical protein [Chlorobiota bacterium]